MVLGGNSVKWEVTKQVRRKEAIGCVPLTRRPKPDGESVGCEKVIKPCIKHYHDAEEALWKSRAWSKQKFDARKKMRTRKAGTRSSAISGLRAPEAATEFIRLRDRYLDSSRAYQGGGSGLEDADILTLHRIGSAGLLPDCTVLLTLDPAEAARRGASLSASCVALPSALLRRAPGTARARRC